METFGYPAKTWQAAKDEIRVVLIDCARRQETIAYSELVQKITGSSAKQVRIGQQQLDQSQRPFVVIEWRYVPPPPTARVAGWMYVARNIGQGVAVNVVHVESLDDAELHLLHIGALGAGQSVELPQDLVEQLNRRPELTTESDLIFAYGSIIEMTVLRAAKDSNGVSDSFQLGSQSTTNNGISPILKPVTAGFD